MEIEEIKQQLSKIKEAGDVPKEYVDKVKELHPEIYVNIHMLSDYIRRHNDIACYLYKTIKTIAALVCSVGIIMAIQNLTMADRYLGYTLLFCSIAMCIHTIIYFWDMSVAKKIAPRCLEVMLREMEALEQVGWKGKREE